MSEKLGNGGFAKAMVPSVPPEEILRKIMKLRNDADFQVFSNFLLELATKLAFFSCNPQLSEKLATQFQGRVLQLADINRWITDAHLILESIEKGKAQEKSGGVV